MAYSINGFGTHFYGSAEPHPDGSYVVTTWVVAFFIPLVPLGSKRVLPIKWEDLPPNERIGRKYRSMDVPLHVPHLLKGWGVTLAIVLAFALLSWHNHHGAAPAV